MLLVLQQPDEGVLRAHDHSPQACEICARRKQGGLEAAFGQDAEMKGLFIELLLFSVGWALPREEIHSWTKAQQQEVYEYALSKGFASRDGKEAATQAGQATETESGAPDVLHRSVKARSG